MTNPKLKCLQIYFGISIFALLDSLFLLFHHYKVNILHLTDKSFCSVNSFIDCDQVAQSAFSVLLTYPSAAWAGFSYLFLIITGVLLLTILKQQLIVGLKIIFLITTAMLIFSFYEFFASIFILQKICVLCSLLYVAIILLNANIYFLLKSHHANFEVRSIFKESKLLRLLLFFTASAFISALIFIVADKAISSKYHSEKRSIETERLATETLGQKNAPPSKPEPSFLIKEYEKLPSSKLNLTLAECTGPETAPITLVTFTDLHCPYCLEMGNTLENLLPQFENEIRHCYFNFPLDKSCNKAITNQLHDGACQAARVLLCLQTEEAKKQLFDGLHSGKIDKSEAGLNLFLKNLVTDKISFEACLLQIDKKRLLPQIEEGIRQMIEYTPTVFLNNKRVSDILEEPDDIEELLYYLLGKPKE